MTHNLRKAVIAGLGIAALAGVSSVASAQTTTYIGTLTGSFTQSAKVANFAWDGHNASGGAANLGWGHNSRWYTFNVTSLSSLNIKMTGTDLNPAFSLWKTTGYTDPGTVSSQGHTYSQVSTDSPESEWLTDPAQGGVTAFVGYANSGPAFVNGVGLNVGHGSAGSSWGPGFAELTTNINAGNYLLAIGGSDSTNPSMKGSAKDFTLTMNVAAVPEPEEYLMMLMGAGMVGFQVKRKKASKA